MSNSCAGYAFPREKGITFWDQKELRPRNIALNLGQGILTLFVSDIYAHTHVCIQLSFDVSI